MEGSEQALRDSVTGTKADNEGTVGSLKGESRKRKKMKKEKKKMKGDNDDEDMSF